MLEILNERISSVLAAVVIDYLSCEDHLQSKVVPTPALLKHRLKLYPNGHPEATACHLLLHHRTPKLTLDQINALFAKHSPTGFGIYLLFT